MNEERTSEKPILGLVLAIGKGREIDEMGIAYVYKECGTEQEAQDWATKVVGYWAKNFTNYPSVSSLRLSRGPHLEVKVDDPDDILRVLNKHLELQESAQEPAAILLKLAQ